MTRSFSLFASLLVILMAVPVTSLAEGFGINATRLIYPQQANGISVTVRNTMAKVPYLVQARVSTAQDGSAPAPFLVRPPLFRLEPGSVNKLRIVATELNLPTDRESVFYFHASAIPASSGPQSDNQQVGVNGMAQFGVGSIIKLFYRPDNLPSLSTAAQKGLQFSWSRSGLQVSNPSPYFVSFASIDVGGQKLKLDNPAALMLAPFGSHTYPARQVKGEVQWQTINDEGGINEHRRRLP